MLRLFSLLTCFLWTLLFSCQQADVTVTDPGTDYAPLETGRFIIYDVTEQRYSLTAPPATTTYQLKETIGSPYTDVTGQPAYRLQRYRRANAQAAWQTDSLWTARSNTQAAIRTENGADFVKLIFPLTERAEWNGNAYNQFQKDIYTLRQVRKPYTVGTQTFAETATVVQHSDSNLVAQDKRLEVYAKQIGMIYREVVQLQFCSSGTCVGKGQIDFGVRRYVRLASYGKE
ncbi:hypothetical protein J2I47_19390 [Fibrella sp. HMF5335]|uniref:Lipoprotein n=1 Tax=Fibrella rubiginis TaxID=2817060 RepID=A0A939K4S5_9BACT|nr:hypothetical protein [Fibrella rubiginis]MBO0938724.1 hypothetical protein [Fibrella rubiginis]